MKANIYHNGEYLTTADSREAAIMLLAFLKTETGACIWEYEIREEDTP